MMEISIQKFMGTIMDLTNIAKVQKITEEDIDLVYLPEIIQDVKISMQEELKATNALLMVDFNAAENIRFSRKNLKSVLYNLLSNAVKYKSNDRSPVVKVSTQLEPDYIVLTVSDNGLGIAGENISKIFSMFKRFHTHVEGTGVGLYIVKRIVDNANGKIEVESDPGKGSIFKIWFPN